MKAQGEILEGLVARLVSQDSSNHIEKILKEFPPPPVDGGMLIDSRNIMSKLLATPTFLIDALMFITIYLSTYLFIYSNFPKIPIRWIFELLYSPRFLKIRV